MFAAADGTIEYLMPLPAYQPLDGPYFRLLIHSILSIRHAMPFSAGKLLLLLRKTTIFRLHAHFFYINYRYLIISLNTLPA